MLKNINFFKKTLSLMLIVLLAVVFAISTSAYTVTAVSDKKIGQVTYMQNFYDENKGACDRVAEGIANMEEEIDLREYELSSYYYDVLVNQVLGTHPELFYVKSFKVTLKDHLVLFIKPDYIPKEEVKEMKKVFDKRVEELLSLVNDNMSDIEKVATIHDELVLSCEYDDTGFTSYETIVNHKGTCQGYNSAFSYLLSLMGIDCEKVTSLSMNHAWLKLCLGDEWYNVDIMWDDPTPDRQVYVTHDYFLLSDEAISANHYGAIEQTHKALSKKYDNSIIHDIDTRFCYSNSEMYAVFNSVHSKYTDKYYKKLLKLDLDTCKCEIVREFEYNWPFENSGYWYGHFSSLDVHDNILYYNSPFEIFMFDPKTGYIASFSDSFSNSYTEHCYGFVINNGELNAAIGSNPNLSFKIKPMGKCSKKPFYVGKTQTMIFDNKARRKALFGDAYGDGVINIADSTEIQKYTVELISFDKYKKVAADANGDGDINVLDCTAIQKYIVGLD